MTQDTEFEKWFGSAATGKALHYKHTADEKEIAKAAFRTGRLAQRDIDAGIARSWNSDSAASAIKGQEI